MFVSAVWIYDKLNNLWKFFQQQGPLKSIYLARSSGLFYTHFALGIWYGVPGVHGIPGRFVVDRK